MKISLYVLQTKEEVVLLDRVDYIDKMTILSDSTKFLRMHCDDVLGLTIRLEDKINNSLIN